MEIPTNPSAMIDLLRAWFFAKDRSIVLADDTRLYLGANQIGPSGVWTLISESELSASIATITFSLIPSIFRTLAIVVQAETDNVAVSDTWTWQANEDNGNNYDRMFWYGRGNNTRASSAQLAQSAGYGGWTSGTTTRANNWNNSIVMFPGYTETDREKWSLCLLNPQVGNVSSTASLFIANWMGHWRNTAAINTLTILPLTGVNFLSGSIFSLYGIL